MYAIGNSLFRLWPIYFDWTNKNEFQSKFGTKKKLISTDNFVTHKSRKRVSPTQFRIIVQFGSVCFLSLKSVRFQTFEKLKYWNGSRQTRSHVACIQKLLLKDIRSNSICIKSNLFRFVLFFLAVFTRCAHVFFFSFSIFPNNSTNY